MQARRVLTIVAISAVGLIGVGWIALACCVPIFGDPEPPGGVQILNLTDQRLKVYRLFVTVDPDTPDKRLIAEIPPNETAGAAGGPCIMDEVWVARAPDRTVVARMGPFAYCNEGPWIITTEPPEPSRHAPPSDHEIRRSHERPTSPAGLHLSPWRTDRGP